jgi:uncharacterized protein (TIGR02996 family)
MTHPELSRLLECLKATPDDGLLWSALADCLEENAEPDRAELVRLNRRLRGMKKGPKRTAAETRVRELVNGGVRPCVPEAVNSIGMRLALIPAGTFWMGSPQREKGRGSDETLHHVTLTRPFWMGLFPVTQAQWRAVMGNNPAWFSRKGGGAALVKGMDTGAFPVEQVSWEEASRFCRKLTKRCVSRGQPYRLPTEAEWEYVCRAGIFSTPFHSGDILDAARANVEESGLKRTCAAGSYPPNAWGVHDLDGNILEWCAGRYGPYPAGPVSDPPGPRGGERRVIRGGSWNCDVGTSRSANRLQAGQAHSYRSIGFRVVLDLTRAAP